MKQRSVPGEVSQSVASGRAERLIASHGFGPLRVVVMVGVQSFVASASALSFHLPALLSTHRTASIRASAHFTFPLVGPERSLCIQALRRRRLPISLRSKNRGITSAK